MEKSTVPWMALFTFILAILKLTGTITLGWWWVFMPMWLPIALALVVFAGVALFAGVMLLIAAVGLSR